MAAETPPEEKTEQSVVETIKEKVSDAFSGNKSQADTSSGMSGNYSQVNTISQSTDSTDI